MKHRLDIVTYPRVLHSPDNCTPTHYYSVGDEAMKTLGAGMLLGLTARLRIWRKLQISGTGNLRITYCYCQLFTDDDLNKKKQHRHLSHQLSLPVAASYIHLQAGEIWQVQNCNQKHRDGTT